MQENPTVLYKGVDISNAVEMVHIHDTLLGELPANNAVFVRTVCAKVRGEDDRMHEINDSLDLIISIDGRIEWPLIQEANNGKPN